MHQQRRVREFHLQSAIDLVDAVAPGTGLFRGGAVFRGQADANWGLVPAVFRQDVPCLLNERAFPRDDWVYGSQVKLEIELLWLFVARANEAGLAIPGDSDRVRELLDEIRNDGFWVADASNLRNWPPRDLIPSLALAQHHGVATRLLDWTYNPLVAVYFAAAGAASLGERAGRLAVWACSLREGDRRRVWLAPSVMIERPSNAFNHNLRSQRGCLMVWRKGADRDAAFHGTPLEVLLAEEADRRGVVPGPIFQKLTLPQSESGALLQLLSANMVDGAIMFPGFDGVARVVRERQFWNGYRGTGATDFQAELNKRAGRLLDRLSKYAASESMPEPRQTGSTQDKDGYGLLRERVAVLRRSIIDAGDYDPDLPGEVKRLQDAIASDGKRMGRSLRSELEEVLKELIARC